jgi:hypothetical protein
MTDRRLPTRPAIILALPASAYLAAQMLDDVTSLKVTEVAGWSVDAGTLVIPSRLPCAMSSTRSPAPGWLVH